MGTTERSDPDGDAARGFGRPLPEFVDWIAAVVIALAGVALSVGGSALTFVVDREMLERGVESGEITVIIFERDLSEAEMLEFTREVVNWTGIGLLVTGVGLVLFAIGYVLARHRAHRQSGDDDSAGSYRANAVLGGVTSSLLSFVPFSPVLGGILAGYFEHYGSGRSVSVGALSGFLAALPGLAILGFVTAGMYAGLSAVGEGGLGIVTVVAMILAFLLVGVYGVGLGAVGGFAGSRLAERNG